MDERYDFYRQQPAQDNGSPQLPGSIQGGNGLDRRGTYYRNIFRSLPSDSWEYVSLLNVSATVAEWWYDPLDHTKIYPYPNSWLWFYNVIPLTSANLGLQNGVGMALSELKLTYALLNASGTVVNDAYIAMRFSNTNLVGAPPYTVSRVPPVDLIKTRSYDTATTRPTPATSFNGIRLTLSTTTNLVGGPPAGTVALLRQATMVSEKAGL